MRALAFFMAISLSATAFGSSMMVTTDIVTGAMTDMGQTSSEGSSTSLPGDEKIILAAKEDAAAYVASKGSILGAQLEAAFLHIRGQSERPWTDADLAESILIF